MYFVEKWLPNPTESPTSASTYMVCSIKGMKNVSVPTTVAKCMNNSIDEPPFYKQTSTGSNCNKSNCK